MERYVTSLLSRYHGRGVLVDTNLLLLFYVGSYNRALVERFPRTADRFVSANFDTLDRVLSNFDSVVVTPHILTEVSNLLGQLGEPARLECFKRFAHSIPTLSETNIAGAELAQREPFVKLGITDTSILEIAAKPYLVLTDDFRLYNHLQDRGIDVLNFNHLRALI